MELVTHFDFKSVTPKYCNKGARAFFDRHGLDWGAFVSKGVPIEQIEQTGDAMALAVIDRIREKWAKAAR